MRPSSMPASSAVCPGTRPQGLRGSAHDGKVNGDDQLALTDNHDQEDPINTGEHPVFLPTPPGADESQLVAILFEHRVIGDPGPLPPATCGLRSC